MNNKINIEKARQMGRSVTTLYELLLMVGYTHEQIIQMFEERGLC